MQLLSVFYELFDWDAERLDERGDTNGHELQGEIRLEDAGGEQLYISWGWLNSPVMYGIEISSQRFCKAPLPIQRDLTSSLLWAGLIGKELTFTYLDWDHQVLEIRGEAACVYCSSHGDTVHVSATRQTLF